MVLVLMFMYLGWWQNQNKTAVHSNILKVSFQIKKNINKQNIKICDINIIKLN